MGGIQQSEAHSQRSPGPAFSWSESKHRRFTECRRKHYWAVYAQYNGWRAPTDSFSRLAWALGKLVPSWGAALGTSLHARAAECVAACRSRAAMPTFADLRRAAPGRFGYPTATRFA